MIEEMMKAIRDYSRREDDTDETAGIDLMLTEHIDWFLRHLWHDASEKPDPETPIVTLYNGTIVNTTRRNFTFGFGRFCPDKWCYLEDILPSKKD